jgi:uncharacterized membrane protein YphA (DoxX/SURF4 family)
MDTKRSYAPVVLRIGVCLVYLWFGISQIMNQSRWVAMVPEYASLVPISTENLVLINGISEVVLAILLLIGWRVRIVALLLTIHAFHIMTVVGYTPIGVRDFGIFIAVLSVFLYGADRWSLDSRKTHNEVSM